MAHRSNCIWQKSFRAFSENYVFNFFSLFKKKRINFCSRIQLFSTVFFVIFELEQKNVNSNVMVTKQIMYIVSRKEFSIVNV